MCRYDNNTSVVKFHFTTSSTGQQIVCTSTVPMYIFEEDTQDKLTCSPLGKKTYVLVGQNNVPSRRQRNKGLRTFQPHRSTLWPRGNVPIVEIPLRRKLISTICYFIFLMRQQENTGGDFAHVQRQNLFRWCQSSPKTGQRGNVSGTSILFKDDQFFFFTLVLGLCCFITPPTMIVMPWQFQSQGVDKSTYPMSIWDDTTCF